MTYGVYVHVPWCHARCPYCAFAVVPLRTAPEWRPYAARVAWERERRRDVFPDRPATVFFGGGTPSRLPPEALAQIVSALDPLPGAEVSAEVNPEDLTDDWLAGAVAAGVTRLSVGVQSFVPHVARWLGRGHTQTRAEEALRAVAQSGIRSFSADLIFAVPGQALADLDADLDRLLALGVPHVSLYGLTFEPGTRHGAREARGKVEATDPDAWRAMYDHLVARLSRAGLARYEVSNFARDGHRCAHNRLYWSDRPYLGLGPSAHGYEPDGSRYVNAELDQWLTGEPTASRERPDPHARFTDLVVTSLRAVEGVDLGHLAAVTGLRPDPAAVARFVRAGLLEEDGERLRLTDEGFPVCDGLVAKLTERPA